MYQKRKPLDSATFSISNLANRCRKTLQELYTLVKEQNEDLTTSTLYNVNGRFNVWGSNLAAFRRKDSVASLDWRLRKAEQMTEAVKTTLIDIIQASEEADSILRDDRRNGQKSDMEALFEGIDLEDPGNQELSEFLNSITTELDALLNSIALSVDRLFTLAMLIRRESTNRPHGNNKGNMNPGIDPGRDNHIVRLKDKHPGLLDKEWLQHRLADAFDHRRSSILDLQTKRPVPSFEIEAETGSSQYGPSVAATTYQEDEKRHESLEDGSVSSTASFVTKTSFVTAIQTGEDGELEIMDLERLAFHKVRLRYGESFTCPLCREFIVVTSREEWKSHILTDLRPYLCTFEECHMALFPKRHEWFGHELEFHRTTWHCHKCEMRFGTAELLGKHFVESHGNVVPESQISMILKSANRPTQDFSGQACPFCSPLWHVPHSESNQAMALCRHIGKHFQELAVLAIPAVIQGLEIAEEREDDVEESEEDEHKGSNKSIGGETDESTDLVANTTPAPISNVALPLEITMARSGGDKKSFKAIWSRDIAYNMVTERARRVLGLQIRPSTPVEMSATFSDIGDVSLGGVVSATLSNFEMSDLEHKTDFLLVRNGNLRDADVLLGSHFMHEVWGETKAKEDQDADSAEQKIHTITAYRIRQRVLETWLQFKYGPTAAVTARDGEYVVMTPRDAPQIKDEDVRHLKDLTLDSVRRLIEIEGVQRHKVWLQHSVIEHTIDS